MELTQIVEDIEEINRLMTNTKSNHDVNILLEALHTKLTSNLNHTMYGVTFSHHTWNTVIKYLNQYYAKSIENIDPEFSFMVIDINRETDIEIVEIKNVLHVLVLSGFINKKYRAIHTACACYLTIGAEKDILIKDIRNGIFFEQECSHCYDKIERNVNIATQYTIGSYEFKDVNKLISDASFKP